MYIINILLNYTNILLDIFYILTIFCGISILTQQNSIVSIIYFMLVYVTSSLYLYFTGYNAMPLLIILIYVGAIAILFLFILTLINVKEQEEQNIYNNSGQFIIFINIFIILLLYIINYNENITIGSQLYNILDKILFSLYNGFDLNNIINDNYNILFNTPILDYPISTIGEIVIIGQLMYTTYGLILLILGIILILSMIGAIAILFTKHNVNIK